MAAIPYSGLGIEPGAPGTIIPDDYQRISSSPADFGGLTAQAEQSAAGALGQVGDAANKIIQLHNQAATDDAVNQLGTQVRAIMYGDPNDPNSKGYLASQGKAAMVGYGPTTQKLQAARDQLSANLNPQQRIQFDEQSRRYISSLMDSAGAHSIQQGMVWQQQTAKATVDNHLQDAQAALSTGNEQGWMQGVGTAQQASEAYLRAHGADDATIQDASRQIYSRAASQRILQQSVTDPIGAQAFYQKVAANIDPASQAAIQETLKTRVDTAQAQNGVQTVYGAPSGTSALSPTDLGGTVDRIIGAESGGNPTAQNPNSSAGGVGQFINSTWLSTVKQHAPDVAAGKSDADILAMKKDTSQAGVAFARQMTTAYAQDNSQALQQAGLPVTPANIYAAHFFGPDTAIKVIGATPDTPMAALVSPAALSANPQLQGKTAGQVQQSLANKMGAGSTQPLAQAAAGPADPASPYHVPDLGTLLQKADAYADQNNLSYEARQKLEAGVMAQHSRMNAVGETERQNLRQSMSDLLPALQQGLDLPIPEARIRAAFPPDQADRMVQELTIEKQAGTLMKGLQFAPLDQAQQAVASLQVPGSVQSGRIVLRRGQLAGQGTLPQGSVPATADQSGPPVVQGDPMPAAPPLSESPVDMRMRLQVSQRAQTMLQQRQQALAADPAGYAALSPDVQTAARAIDPKDPNTLQAYASSTIALQKQMGVQDAATRILTNGEVAGLVAKITKQDPSQGDTGAQLDAMAQQYGKYWPQVFGEMVTAGKLPPQYQMLANMDQPGQTVARQDFQRALAFTAQKGGTKGMLSDLPQGAEQEMRQNVDGIMSDLRATTAATNQGGLQLYNQTKDGVMTLAGYRLASGTETNATAAVQHAYDDMIGQKYDFSGTMRVPKGQLGDAQSATTAALQALQPGDIKQIAPGSTPGLTPEDTQAAYVRDVKADGYWVPNKMDDGLTLVRPVRNSKVPQQVFKQDGSPFDIKFRDMKYAGPAAAKAAAAANEQLPVNTGAGFGP